MNAHLPVFVISCLLTNITCTAGTAGTADARPAGTGATLSLSEAYRHALAADATAHTAAHTLAPNSSNDVDLKIGGYLQFRYMTSLGDDLGGVTESDHEGGFSLERTRLYLKGKVHDVDFYILPYAGPSGSWSVLDVWGKAALGDSGWTVLFGQFKLPLTREYLLSERYNQMVERSNVDAVFSQSYSQGLQLENFTDDVHIALAFSDGLRTLNTDYNSTSEADYALTARIEYKPAGNWKQFQDMTSLDNGEPGFMIGAALHHQGETMNFRGSAIDQLTQYTIDLNYEGINCNLSVAAVGRNIKLTTGDSMNDWGIYVQGGHFIAEKTEIFARYSVLIPDSDAAGDDAFNTVTAGVNHYFYGHALKLTVDTVWFLDDPNDTTMIGFGANPSTGLLATSDADEIAIRAQLQLIF